MLKWISNEYKINISLYMKRVWLPLSELHSLFDKKERTIVERCLHFNMFTHMT